MFNKLFQTILVIALLSSCKMQKDLSLGAVVQLKTSTKFTSDLEKNDFFKLDVIVVKNSGIKWKTSGMYPWTNLKVEVQNGEFKNGFIFFDRKKVEGKLIKVKISSVESPNIADSIFVDVPKINKLKLISSNDNFSPTTIPTISCEFTFSSGKKIISSSSDPLFNRLKLSNNALIYNGKTFDWTADFFDLFYEKAEIVATLDTDNSIRDTLTKTIDYSSDFVFNANGKNGRHGNNGDDGYSGTIDNPNGFHAGSGGCGQHGFNAPYLEIDTKLLDINGDHLVNISISESNHILSKRWLNVSKGAKLILKLNGGYGGNGGNGGDGGRGIDGSAGIAPGYGGNGGNGGCAGNGGNAGSAIIKGDSLIYKFRSFVHSEFNGGLAGVPGTSGKSGRGGQRNSPNLLQMLFTGRSGSSGIDGQFGNQGKQGRVVWELK